AFRNRLTNAVNGVAVDSTALWPTSMDKHILSSPEAGIYIGKTESTMRQWRMRQIGPPFIRQNRSISYLKEDLDQYLAEHRCGGPAPNVVDPQPAPQRPQPKRIAKPPDGRGGRRRRR